MRSFLPPACFYLPLSLMLPSIGWAQSASLTVDATQTVRTVDERVFGVNAVIWDGQTGSAQTISLLSAAGLRALRIPGGSASDEYHWRTNTRLLETWTWSAGMDSFAKLITGLNAQTFVTVNYGSGTPEEAAAWVAYANASATLQGTSADINLGAGGNGYDWKTAGVWSALRNTAPLATDDGMNFLRISRSSPFGLKYWEIGNECYGTWETDQQSVAHDPYTYAVRAKDYIAKMKAVDPTIKVGVVVITGEDTYANNTTHPAINSRTGAVHNGWTPVLLTTLKSLGVTPDFLIYHRYEQAPAVDQPTNPEGDAKLLQMAKTWPQDAADLRQQAKDYLGSVAGTAVELVVTENNSVYSSPGKQTTSLVNGLYLADSVGNLLQTEFNALLWWDLRNGPDNAQNNSSSLYGWRNYGDYGILSTPASFGASTSYDPYPTYYALKLLANFARGGDAVVKATSGSTLLSVFAVKRTDGTLRLLVINKDPNTTFLANIALTGFTPGTSATTYSYGKPQDDAAKPGGSGATDIDVSGLGVVGSVFTATFAPYSATVISLTNAGSSSSSSSSSSSGSSSSGGSGGGGALGKWYLAALSVAVLARLTSQRKNTST